MADWDADDFDPDADGKLTAPRVTDKWDGEDEDDDIKVFIDDENIIESEHCVTMVKCTLNDDQDAWDAESDEDKDDSQKEETKVVKVKKKKTLQQKIAEKEEAAAKAREERLAREEEEKQLNTPEGWIWLFLSTFFFSDTFVILQVNWRKK